MIAKQPQYYTRWTFTMVTDRRDKVMAMNFTRDAEIERLRALVGQWRWLAWFATLGFLACVVITLIYGAGWCK